MREIYHYDNLTDCETACEIPCGTTYVIRNDVDERRQFICMQRKTPVVSAFINISTTGIIPFILAAALILCGLLLIMCCCCIRCGCACCRRMCHSRNSSNDPLVNGEFRETLDSKDIGYLKKEADRKIITVTSSCPFRTNASLLYKP
uniref:Brain protein I3 n=1 Tax=Elaeophora elaphi TaxID=1147741 RepID=A0A0R3RJ67_9BILA